MNYDAFDVYQWTNWEKQTKFTAIADAFRSIQAIIISNICIQIHKIIFSPKMIYKLFEGISIYFDTYQNWINYSSSYCERSGRKCKCFMLLWLVWGKIYFLIENFSIECQCKLQVFRLWNMKWRFAGGGGGISIETE